MKKLVGLLMGPEGDISDDLAARTLAALSRADLKRLRDELRRRIAKDRVSVAVSGEMAGTAAAMHRRFPGRPVDVGQDESLGAGVRVRDGDDIMDESVHGYIRNIIEKLGEK